MKLLQISKTFKILGLILMGVLISASAQADNKAVERAQAMLRQLNAQKVQLESKNAGLTAKLDALQKQHKKSDKQLKKQKSGNKKLSIAVKKRDEFIKKLREKLKQTRFALRKSEYQRLQANKLGQALDTEMKQCVSNNNNLVSMNDKLIERYNKKGCWDSISQNEPFTGLNQVEMENILQKYRFENEDYEVSQNTEYAQVGEANSIVPDEDDN